MINVLAFIVTIAVLIVVHEYGHYRVAVACGVKVIRFSVGFGRVLWRRQPRPDGTEFVVCALPFGGYVRMLDEREGAVDPAEADRAFNRKSLWQRSAIVAAGPVANLLLAVVLYSAAHWIGVNEPKALLGPPPAASVADKAGLHAGDWVKAWSDDGTEWHDVRSMVDLRWVVTQSLLHGDNLDLMVSDRDGRGQRRVTLDLASLASSEVDAKLMQTIGLGFPWSEPVLGDVTAGGAAAAAGLKPGDRVLSIDDHPIADAVQVRDAIRAAGAGVQPLAMHWVVERGTSRLELVVTPKTVIEGGERFGRIDAYPGQPPQMVAVHYGVVEGFTSAMAQTWQMSSLTVKMLGKMIIGQASLKNLSGPLTIAD